MRTVPNGWNPNARNPNAWNPKGSTPTVGTRTLGTRTLGTRTVGTVRAEEANSMAVSKHEGLWAYAFALFFSASARMAESVVRGLIASGSMRTSISAAVEAFWARSNAP
jgi:hypothetical protein